MADHDPTEQLDVAAATGARAVQALMRTITDLSIETRDQFGVDVDGRDYMGIAAAIEDSIRQHFVDGSPARRQAFVDGLAHALCNATGNLPHHRAGIAAVEVMEASFVADWLPLLAQRASRNPPPARVAP